MKAFRALGGGHKGGVLVFAILNRLKSSPEVLVTKLVSGKVTLVHRKLWPELLAIGPSREPWQTRDLTGEAMVLFDIVEKDAEFRTDAAEWEGKQSVGDIVRELEKRLLIQSEEIHTAKGSHAKILRSWTHRSELAKPPRKLPDVDGAKKRFEKLVNRLNEESGSRGRLPWLWASRTCHGRG